jgi:CPA2 family monovalent cation:H+ antiporter-2
VATETALVDVGILFTAVAFAGILSSRIDQSVIPFYIIIGMVLGSNVLGELPALAGTDVGIGGVTVTVPEVTIGGMDLLAALGGLALGETDFIVVGAEIGIVLLLFFLGLEFNLDRLLASRDRIGKAGSVDLAINFGTGLVFGYLVFGSFLAAFLTAGIVYISSSAIITKSLIDLGWIANDEAEPLLGTLVYEDLFIAVYLTIASALVLGGGDVGAAAGQIGIAIGVILALLALVTFGTGFFQRFLDADTNEFIVVRALGVTILVAGIALALGVSEAVAAFFVGMTFSSTDHVHDLERLLEPLRDAFAAIFFFWIGLVTDPGLFTLSILGMIVAAVVVTTPTKLVSGFLGGRIYGLDDRRSLRVGFGMATRGEFSLIIASLALSGAGSGIAAETAQTIYAFTVGYVLVMSILGTSLMQYSSRIEPVVVSALERHAVSEGIASTRSSPLSHLCHRRSSSISITRSPFPSGIERRFSRMPRPQPVRRRSLVTRISRPTAGTSPPRRASQSSPTCSRTARATPTRPRSRRPTARRSPTTSRRSPGSKPCSRTCAASTGSACSPTAPSAPSGTNSRRWAGRMPSTPRS